MVLCAKFVLCVILVAETFRGCNGQFAVQRNLEMSQSPLPFPVCRADNIECLRRGIRTFFFLMNTHQFNMQPVDPTIINSIALALPDQQMSFLLRRVNVTGANWTKLTDRRFSLENGRSGVLFTSDLHVTGQLIIEDALRLTPYTATLTMDIHSIESNITYPWSIVQGFDNEDYIEIGPERIAVRNSRTPTFFIQTSIDDDFRTIEETLELRQSELEHFANEITVALMHTIVDNFRLFASYVPIRYYYQYYTKDV